MTATGEANKNNIWVETVPVLGDSIRQELFILKVKREVNSKQALIDLKLVCKAC